MPARVESGFLGGARSVSPTGQGQDPRCQRGMLSRGAVYLAGPPVAVPTAAAGFSPNYLPFPLEEVGRAVRDNMFKTAARCFEKARGRKPKGLSDADALKKASVVPETTDEARKKVIEQDIAKLRRSYRESLEKAKTPQEKAALVRGQNEVETLLRTKLKRGRALVDSKPPRILIDPKLHAAARGGKTITGEGSARMIYRLTFLEEQAHIYLHLRGIDVTTAVEASLDEMLAGVEGSGSCHHKAIPMARKSYIARRKQDLGDVDTTSLKID